MQKSLGLQWAKAICAGTTLSLGMIAATTVALAQAETAVQELNVPAGPLRQSLIAISNAFDGNVISSEDIVAGKTAPPVSGTLTLEEAVNTALEGSGLAVNRSASGAFVIAQQDAEVQQTPPQAGFLSNETDGPLIKETIVVTAQLREQKLQDVPISMSVFDNTDISDANITDTVDIVIRSPNVFQTQAGSRGQASSLSIRGVTSSNADFATPTVALIQDGLKQIGGYDFSFFDVERVEVLRGPQGTLYGGGSPGGVISVVSRRPSNTWEALADLTYRRFENRSSAEVMQARAALGGPITDTLSFRATGSTTINDGYIENTFLDEDAEDQEEFSYRGQLLFNPNADWEVLINVNGYKYDGAFGAFATVEALENAPWTVSNNILGDQDQTSNTQILTIRHMIGDLEITSITGNRNWESQETLDVDYTPDQLAVDSSGRDLDQFSQELRIASPSDPERFEWLIGGFFSKETQVTRGRFSFFPPLFGATAPSTDGGDLTIEQINYAIFGQVKVPLTDRLFVTGGLRYDYVEREADSRPVFIFAGMEFPEPPLQGEADFESLLPKVALEFRQSDDLNLYASIARGYKPGGFPSFNFRAGNEIYDSEFSWNYEIGAKTKLLNGRIQLNAAVFYIDITDQQFTSFIRPNVIAIDNIGKSHSVGFEIEVEASLTPELDAFASIGFVDAEIDELDADTSGAIEGGRPANVPDNQIGFGLSYSSEIGLHARAEALLIGDYFLDGRNLLKEDGYSLVNLRIGWRFEHSDVSFFAENLLNEDYLTRAFGGTLPGQTFVGRQGDPRNFGVVLRIEL